MYCSYFQNLSVMNIVYFEKCEIAISAIKSLQFFDLQFQFSRLRFGMHNHRYATEMTSRVSLNLSSSQINIQCMWCLRMLRIVCCSSIYFTLQQQLWLDVSTGKGKNFVYSKFNIRKLLLTKHFLFLIIVPFPNLIFAIRNIKLIW